MHSLFIHPIDDELVLYVDSGNDTFDPEDLRTLVAEHARCLRGKTLGPGFWEVLDRHDWPGKVRELINVLKRAGIQLAGESIGAEIASLCPRRPSDPPSTASTVLARVRNELAMGRSFWDTAWEAFLERDLNRAELQALLEEEFAAARHNLKELCRHLHVADEDYPRFVSALHKYRVHPGHTRDGTDAR